MYNVAHTNVPLRRAHSGWGNSKYLLDSLTSKTKFGDHLLVGESSEESMGPGVDANFVAGHVFLDQDTWVLNDAGADNKEGGRYILIIKKFEQFSA